MKTALVTGGAGFIGSHLARRLLAEGWSVYIVDNLSTGFKDNIPEKAEFIYLDLSKDDFCKELPKVHFDVIFHLAAQSSGEISFDDPVYDLKTNCMSTLLLADWCIKNKINRYIYTSSMSIYGDQEVQPVQESAMPSPKSFYGVGKLTSESYLDIYANMGLNVTSLRLFNVYGPGEIPGAYRNVIPNFTWWALQGKPLPITGTGEETRDFTFVEDIVDGTLRLGIVPEAVGDAFNLASETETRVIDIANTVNEITGNKNSPTFLPRRDWDKIIRRRASIEKARKILGYEPKMKIKDGIGRVYKWVVDNREQIEQCARF